MTKVLFDHNMPPRIAFALHEIIKVEGHEAYPLRDIFTPSISDVDYFAKLNSEWIVISKDLKNAKRRAEKSAILNNRIVAFYLSPALRKKRINEQAASILWHWDKMLHQRALVRSGLFQLPENKSQFRPL